MLANRAMRMLADGRLSSYLGNVYREKTAWLEQHLAEKIFSQSVKNKVSPIVDVGEEISAEEARLKLRFAAEQKAAIETALTAPLCVITGGPGTGKTMIQRAILEIYQKNHPKGRIVCCAPTGRAARRMEESTGHPASTVHRAIGLYAGDDGSFGTPTSLNADLLLVDEVSMLDIFVANALFDAIKPGCQVVLIGDVDQLPSVGPGAVLSEMIASGCVPVVRLDKVYRQREGSRIAINAKLIRHGNLALEYGSDYQFVNSPQLPDSAETMVQLYLQEVRRCGVDNVALLTPYRQKTETSVNALNQRLRDLLNPPMPGKAEVSCGSRVFRCGDKVMQTRNFRDVSNGDIGYITSIHEDGDDTLLHVNFGGRIAEYDLSMLDQLDLGYASTVHKSQGAEYRSVILNLQTAHYIMLTRPLVYTAITRGKEKVIIVGERRALCMAISRTDAERRGTCLAHRLRTIKSENRKDL
ncbi:MAG: AAA family ATPase [Acidaminococcaceae bacterium]|nr:AAA family ATPase [Acidaminococcaceae bacterium]